MVFRRSKKGTVKTPSPRIKELKFMLSRVAKSPLSLLGSAIIIFYGVMALLAPVLAPPNPSWDIQRYPGKSAFIIPRVTYVAQPQPPTPQNPFGLTPDGYDIYYGCVWGSITAFRVGVYVVALSLIAGLSIGLVAGYYGGIIDEILMRFTDVIIVFPGLILAMAFAIALPPSLSITLREVLPIISVILLLLTITPILSHKGIRWTWIILQDATILTLAISILLFTNNLPNLTLLSLELTKLDKTLIALVLVGWPGYTRVIRGEVLRVRTEDYIEASKAAGCSDFRIITRHILPNAVYPVLILASLDIGSIVLTAAALSFLGIGSDPEFADWGQLVQKSQEWISSGNLIPIWYVWVIPGAFIFGFSLGWNLLGDAIRDILDPTLRRR